MKKLTIITLAALTLNGCSPVMEAMRPDPIELSQFIIGEDRTKILNTIGSPISTNKEKANSCDIYQLFTRGPGTAGKGAIAAGEIVADVFTLGLTEVVFTPTEAMTKASKHTVTFCYAPDNKLISLNQSDVAVQ